MTVFRDSTDCRSMSMMYEGAITRGPAMANAVGVDACMRPVATLATGEGATNPEHVRCDRARLPHNQRELSRRAKHCSTPDPEKADCTVARIPMVGRCRSLHRSLALNDLAVRHLSASSMFKHSIAAAASTKRSLARERERARHEGEHAAIHR
ncbi:hypothetical protein ACFYPT_37850 [Streptomyces sp. NPDC005529]|uniref:hypothetical protein n=1 Tax=unclassified Streptomyces TaxID=2593676 RepID=UPI0033A3B69B